MNDLVELDVVKQRFQRGGLGEVAVDEMERLAEDLDIIEVSLLDGRAVKGVEFVERPDGVTGEQQSLANVRADKPRKPPVTRKISWGHYGV